MRSCCSSFRSCNDCKNGAFQCVWCYDIGCTNLPRLHCPQKFAVDYILKQNSSERFCTEIVTRSPVFIPAAVKRVVKLDLKIDDMALYEHNIVCEFQIDYNVIQVKGTLDRNTVLCDAVSLEIPDAICSGYLRLIWVGAEPYSNSMLVIVYKCHLLSQTCTDCQALHEEFKCGWCEDTTMCNLYDECPQQYGPWINRNFTCKSYNSVAFTQFYGQRNFWL